MLYNNSKKYFAVVLSIIMLSGISLFYFAELAQAEGPQGQGPGRTQVSKQRGQARTQYNRPAPAQNYGREQGHSFKGAPAPQHNHFVDSRYQHNRSYPAHGQSFRSLPRDHRMIMHNHSRYYYSHGIWYRPYGGRYVVIEPPFGLFVPFLPLFYTTIWIHGSPYYYANDTYYVQTEGGYTVVEPPQEDESVSQTPPPTDDSMESKLFIYPRKGQSEQQQANDRYECHKWAVDQTNYDPTNISGIPADQIMQKRSDYQRAMTACLDSRGYTAK
jgi:hypothetical protein